MRSLPVVVVYAFLTLLHLTSAQAQVCRGLFLDKKSTDALAAAAPFLEYFKAAQKQIFERDYVIEPFQLAWIAKEHILLIGPPGNAKTTLAKLLMQNVMEVTEEGGNKTESPSFFSQQMTAETSLSDTHGPVDFKVLNQTGRVNRLYEEGILGARLAFIDEQFDMRPNGYRNILDVLAERAHSQGTRTHAGKTWSVVGASNTYLPEVYQKFDGSDQPRALIDRYSFVIYIPAEMEMASSNRAIIQGAKRTKSPLPKLTFEQIEKLQNLVPDVEIPQHVGDMLASLQFRLRPELESREAASVRQQYEKVQAGEKAGPPWRATKHMSPRTLGKAAGILRAIVILDWAQKGGARELTATLDDLARLKRFYALGGPSDKFLDSQLVRATKESEQEQLKSIKLERKIFDDTFEAIRSEFNQTIANYTPLEIMQKAQKYPTLSTPERRLLVDLLKEMYLRTLQATFDMEQEKITPQTIAEAAIHDSVRGWIEQVFGNRTDRVLTDWTKNKPLAERRRGEQKVKRRYWGISAEFSKEQTKTLKKPVALPTLVSGPFLESSVPVDQIITWYISNSTGFTFRNINSRTGIWQFTKEGLKQIIVGREIDDDYRSIPYVNDNSALLDTGTSSSFYNATTETTKRANTFNRPSKPLMFRTKDHVFAISRREAYVYELRTEAHRSITIDSDVSSNTTNTLDHADKEIAKNTVIMTNKEESKAWLFLANKFLLEASISPSKVSLKEIDDAELLNNRFMGMSLESDRLFFQSGNKVTVLNVSTGGGGKTAFELDVIGASEVHYEPSKDWILVNSSVEGIVAFNSSGKKLGIVVEPQQMGDIGLIQGLVFTDNGSLMALAQALDKSKTLVKEFVVAPKP